MKVLRSFLHIIHNTKKSKSSKSKSLIGTFSIKFKSSSVNLSIEKMGVIVEIFEKKKKFPPQNLGKFYFHKYLSQNAKIQSKY